MSLEAWFLVPLAGLLGSLHCVGMCGPFAAYLTVGSPTEQGSAASMRWAAFWRHLAYQSGRLLTYVVLGAVAGWLGHGVLHLGQVLDAQRMVWVVLGLFMIGAGAIHYLPRRWRKTIAPGAPVAGVVGKGMRAIRRQVGGVPAAALIGAMSTLLPCGFLYSFATAAVAMGDPLGGMAIMAGFWLGTVPALASVAFVSTFGSSTLLRRLHNLAPALLILFGLLAVFGKWHGVMPMDGAMAEGGMPACH